MNFEPDNLSSYEIAKISLIQMTAVQYKFLRTDDALDVAELHTAVFPGYFLTELRIEFLRRYYEEIIKQNRLCIGAYMDGQLIGFIISGSNIGSARSCFYRNNFLFCCYNIGTALIRSAIVRKGISDRITQIVSAFLSRMKSDKKNSSDFRLLSIAVHPEYRGKGTAEEMLSKFDENLLAEKIESYGLSVKKENKRAISFYKKSAMIVEKETKDYLYFKRNLK